ncbi:MAG: PAS domain-containing protein [Noviherbaspirillum sp.]
MLLIYAGVMGIAGTALATAIWRRRKRIEQLPALREAEERYRKVVELSPDAILVQQDGVFVFANPAAVAMLRAGDIDQIVGRPLFEFLHADFHEAASTNRLHEER